ncbi:hypothetical protein SDRG_04848 [Saprolegnia diclina VS20]|uniref:PH domain-containing protein n=1 Tax=Saprolegnia diclina (strain VS20) TaxID=1156394 RepID=T0QII6_SAPDV|nr:hypothetical protein SDRG_04848 [Saprolegnia diclina VS20]EQC37824.1 hypothetical protein SDRG_04848 [Saprolegnia diclina VS20]|eukprot:XP_008608757.1 hypothetical protein SDRG_04848 [Saprolegnia diclina VS20]
MEGVLWKRGRMLVSSWHERYFVLKDCTLAYFSKAGDLQTRGILELGPDASVSSIELRKKGGSKSLYCFTIAPHGGHHTPSSTVVHHHGVGHESGLMVGCESRELANVWRNAIIQAIQLPGETLGGVRSPKERASSASIAALPQHDKGRQILLEKMDRKWPMFSGTYNVLSVLGGMQIYYEQFNSAKHTHGFAGQECQSWQQLNSMLVSTLSASVIAAIAGGIGGTSMLTVFVFSLLAAAFTFWTKSGHALHSADVPSFKATRVIPGTPTEVFNLLMDTDARVMWDASVQSVRVLQTIDSHSDILHVVYKPVWIWPMWLPGCDVCLLRYWRETEDGSYVICMQSAVHSECQVSDSTRALCHGGGFTVAPPTNANTLEEPTSLVTFVIHMNPQGLFGVFLRRLDLLFHYIKPQIFALVGLEEAMEARQYNMLTLADVLHGDDDVRPGEPTSEGPAAPAPAPVARAPLLPCTLPSEMWSEPPPGLFMVRGPDYHNDKRKVASAPPAFQLVACDLFDTGAVSIENICARPDNLVQTQSIDGFVFAINLLLPGSPRYSLVLYYQVVDQSVLADGSPFAELMNDFLDGTDEYRNERFKLIPCIVEGNFMVRQAVGSTPAIIGTKLRQPYFKTDKYFELDVDITSSAVANRVTGLVLGYTKKLVIDMGFLIEGRQSQELPERLFGACRMSYVDMTVATKMAR